MKISLLFQNLGACNSVYEKQLSLVFAKTAILSSQTYIFKINNAKTREMCEICSKFTPKEPEKRR